MHDGFVLPFPAGSAQRPGALDLLATEKTGQQVRCSRREMELCRRAEPKHPSLKGWGWGWLVTPAVEGRNALTAVAISRV